MGETNTLLYMGIGLEVCRRTLFPTVSWNSPVQQFILKLPCSCKPMLVVCVWSPKVFSVTAGSYPVKCCPKKPPWFCYTGIL